MRTRAIGTWTPFHTLAVLWAVYLGPLVLLWADRSGVAGAYGPLLLGLLVATGWLAPWWVGALCLAGASVLLPVMDTAVFPLHLVVGSAPLNPGLATYALGLLFLGLGRLARWGWDHLSRAQAAVNEAAEERERKEQLALIFRAAAHEIANPLTPMAIHTRVLLSHPEVLRNEEIHQALQRMDRSVERLSHLVTEFQDVARGLQEELLIEPRAIDLAAVLRDVANDQAAVCRASGLQWESSIPPTLPCVADPGRILQAVVNLCQNAVRYTPTGGTVSMRVMATRGGPVIEVTDTGIGLSGDDLERIFEPFTRLAVDVGYPAGTGLGLWIVRRIARAHGGDVEVESAGTGRGATFRLRLAARARPGAGVLTASASSPAGQVQGAPART